MCHSCMLSPADSIYDQGIGLIAAGCTRIVLTQGFLETGNHLFFVFNQVHAKNSESTVKLKVSPLYTNSKL